MSAEQVRATLALVSPSYYVHHVRLAELASQYRLPSMLGWSEFPKAGGLMSYGPNLNDMFQRCAGLVDKIPMGAAMNKGLTFRMGQTHVKRWTPDLLRRIEEGQIDPSFVITHTVGLEDGPEMYKTFRDKQDGCIKVVIKP